jgi:hypothetical protein
LDGYGAEVTAEVWIEVQAVAVLAGKDFLVRIAE